ncbi:PAS domain S-box protein [Phenylobacterium aquaticum]|uniref:PAS domain S-box protein n=1 Tax=Phenylobacterium aquaticum TaxID=1763816 RepID=UPI0026EB80D9|nr:PAS domain S-box protein [Phenylobacterium aquaticum]
MQSESGSAVHHQGQPSARGLVGIGVAVFVLALGSIAFTGDADRVAAVWPVNAMVVAILLRTPARAWAGYLAVSLVGLIAANLAMGDSTWPVMALSICNGVEILLCASLMRRFAGLDIDLSRQRHLLIFLLVGGGLAPGASALLAILLTGLTGNALVLSNIVRWYAADALGLLIVTPALLALSPGALASLDGKVRSGHGLAPMVVLVASLVAVFGQTQYPLFFLVPPALIFVAFELKLAGSALALLATAVVAVILTLAGHGPTALMHGSMAARLAMLQIFLATMTVSVLPVAAAMTKRSRLEVELRTSLAEMEATRAAIFEAQRQSNLAEQIAGIGHWRRDRASGRAVWSDQMFLIHGTTREDFGGRLTEAIDLYGPEDRPLIHAQILQAFETGEPFDLKVRLNRRDDGRERVVIFKGEAERDLAGEVTAIFGVMRDITDEETARARIAESEARYRLLADSSTDLVVKSGRDQIIQYASPSFSRYGHAPEDLVGSSILSLLHPEDLPKVGEIVAELLAGGDVNPTRDRTYRMRAADGDFIWMEGSPAIIRDADGATTAFISQLRDISERRAANAKLADSEARYRQLADSCTDIVLTVGRDGLIQYVSPSVRRYGYEPDELIGTPNVSLLHSDDLPKLRELMTELFTQDEVDPARDRTYRVRTADGSHVWMEGNPSTVRDENGEIVAIISQLRDVSERRAADAALTESEARYRLLTANATDVIACYGLDANFTFLSPSLISVMGYAPEEMLGRPTTSFMHPDDVRPTLRKFAAYVAAGPGPEPIRFEYRAYRKDGEMVWLEAQAKAIFDAETGEIIEFQDVVRNITERKAIEAALADSETRYRRLADAAPDMISECDAEGRITYVSPASRRIFGLEPEALIGLNAFALMNRGDDAKAREMCQALIDTRGQQTAAPLQYRGRHRDGQTIWMESKPAPMIDPLSGEVTGFIDVVRDITAHKALEEDLERARRAAEAAAEVKGEFLANMSHEIRTPLTAILGFTSLLASRDDLDAEARKYVQRVTSAGQGLLSIVNDILDFSKLEAGLVEIMPRAVQPTDMLRDTLLMFEPLAQAKGLELEFELDGDLPPGLSIDPDRVRQVLLNLIGNAIKFTETGAVRLAAAYDLKRQTLEVRIEDTGVGLSKVQQQKLFQRFSQVDASSTRRHGGTGLGLAICKGLTEAMGGQIGVRSRAGRGSVFHFTISAPTAEPPTAASTGATGGASLEGTRLLVVDDNPVNRELVRAILAPLGVEVTDAVDGLDGADAATKAPFDVILLDIRMPGLTGPQVAERIRNQAGPNQNIPILAFSADADLSMFEGEGSGFDGAVRKPLVPMELLLAISACLQWDEAEPTLLDEAHAPVG